MRKLKFYYTFLCNTSDMSLGFVKKPLNFRDEGLAVEKAGCRHGPRKLKGSRQAGMDSSPLLPPFFAE